MYIKARWRIELSAATGSTSIPFRPRFAYQDFAGSFDYNLCRICSKFWFFFSYPLVSIGALDSSVAWCFISEEKSLATIRDLACFFLWAFKFYCNSGSEQKIDGARRYKWKVYLLFNSLCFTDNLWWFFAFLFVTFFFSGKKVTHDFLSLYSSDPSFQLPDPRSSSRGTCCPAWFVNRQNKNHKNLNYTSLFNYPFEIPIQSFEDENYERTTEGRTFESFPQLCFKSLACWWCFIYFLRFLFEDSKLPSAAWEGGRLWKWRGRGPGGRQSCDSGGGRAPWRGGRVHGQSCTGRRCERQGFRLCERFPDLVGGQIRTWLRQSEHHHQLRLLRGRRFLHPVGWERHCFKRYLLFIKLNINVAFFVMIGASKCHLFSKYLVEQFWK